MELRPPLDNAQSQSGTPNSGSVSFADLRQAPGCPRAITRAQSFRSWLPRLWVGSASRAIFWEHVAGDNLRGNQITGPVDHQLRCTNRAMPMLVGLGAVFF